MAEGLVERIGDEIDRRIDARLGEQPQPAANGSTPPAYRGPAVPTPVMPAAVPPPPAPRRPSGLGGVVLGLGSIGLGLGTTAVVVAHHVQSAAAVVMILLIWAAIAVINAAHSQRKL